MIDRGGGVEQDQRRAENRRGDNAVGIGPRSHDHDHQRDDREEHAERVSDLAGIFFRAAIAQRGSLAKGDGGHAGKLGAESRLVDAGDAFLEVILIPARIVACREERR